MVAALREGRLDPEELVDETGNVSADVLYSGFFMLAPTTIVAQRATLLEHLWNDEFVRGFQAMAQWTRDQVPFPGAAFREVVELFVRRNALMDGWNSAFNSILDFTLLIAWAAPTLLLWGLALIVPYRLLRRRFAALTVIVTGRFTNRPYKLPARSQPRPAVGGGERHGGSGARSVSSA